MLVSLYLLTSIFNVTHVFSFCGIVSYASKNLKSHQRKNGDMGFLQNKSMIKTDTRFFFLLFHSECIAYMEDIWLWAQNTAACFFIKLNWRILFYFCRSGNSSVSWESEKIYQIGLSKKDLPTSRQGECLFCCPLAVRIVEQIGSHPIWPLKPY